MSGKEYDGAACVGGAGHPENEVSFFEAAELVGEPGAFPGAASGEVFDSYGAVLLFGECFEDGEVGFGEVVCAQGFCEVCGYGSGEELVGSPQGRIIRCH